MRKTYIIDMGLLVIAGTVAAVLANEPAHPEKLSHEDIAGELLEFAAEVLDRGDDEDIGLVDGLQNPYAGKAKT